MDQKLRDLTQKMNDTREQLSKREEEVGRREKAVETAQAKLQEQTNALNQDDEMSEDEQMDEGSSMEPTRGKKRKLSNRALEAWKYDGKTMDELRYEYKDKFGYAPGNRIINNRGQIIKKLMEN